MIKAAVLGYGTVGSGVVEVLRTNKNKITEKAGQEIEVSYVLDLRDFPGDPVETILVHDFDVILQDPDVRIVVETMGGVNPAYTFTKQALLAGKSVCTSNKELVAQHGTELLQIAEEKQVHYLFEASCGGGIPIIRVLNEALTADRIEEVTGILNGTTNYILSKMTEEGSDFSDALKEAQEKGYAERNPEADVEGHDACRKIAILSSVAYGKYVDYREISTEGITGISAVDIRYAKALGARIKLLASSRLTDRGCTARVSPVMIRQDSPLYAVNDVFNAVFVHGNMLGDAMFYGNGAGSLPTASAVAADVVACAMHPAGHSRNGWHAGKLELMPAGETESRFFVRVSGRAEERQPEITALFGEAEPVTAPGVTGECGFLTGILPEAVFAGKYEQLAGARNRIRVMW